METDKIRGMLWGLVVGDCLGSSIQFSRKDGHPHITEMEACPVFGLPPGYWTDDGSMAMCVMDSYVRKGGYDLKDSQGNGSIVRFAPSYLIARKEGRREIMHEISDLTHASKVVRNVCDAHAEVLDDHLVGTRTKSGPDKELTILSRVSA